MLLERAAEDDDTTAPLEANDEDAPDRDDDSGRDVELEEGLEVLDTCNRDEDRGRLDEEPTDAARELERDVAPEVAAVPEEASNEVDEEEARPLELMGDEVAGPDPASEDPVEPDDSRLESWAIWLESTGAALDELGTMPPDDEPVAPASAPHASPEQPSPGVWPQAASRTKARGTARM